MKKQDECPSTEIPCVRVVRNKLAKWPYVQNALLTIKMLDFNLDHYQVVTN